MKKVFAVLSALCVLGCEVMAAGIDAAAVAKFKTLVENKQYAEALKMTENITVKEFYMLQEAIIGKSHDKAFDDAMTKRFVEITEAESERICENLSSGGSLDNLNSTYGPLHLKRGTKYTYKHHSRDYYPTLEVVKILDDRTAVVSRQYGYDNGISSAILPVTIVVVHDKDIKYEVGQQLREDEEYVYWGIVNYPTTAGGTVSVHQFLDMNSFRKVAWSTVHFLWKD